MKTFITILAICLCLAVVCGCGVMMTGEYSRLLDETAALSDATATMAENGQLTEAQKNAALRKQATTWRKLQDARDGGK